MQEEKKDIKGVLQAQEHQEHQEQDQEYKPHYTEQEMQGWMQDIKDRVKYLTHQMMAKKGGLNGEDDVQSKLNAQQDIRYQACRELAAHIETCDKVAIKNKIVNKHTLSMAVKQLRHYFDLGLDERAFQALLFDACVDVHEPQSLDVDDVLNWSLPSVQSLQRTLLHSWNTTLTEHLQEYGVEEAFCSGAFDAQVLDILHAFERNKKVEELKNDFPAEALQIAQVLSYRLGDLQSMCRKTGFERVDGVPEMLVTHDVFRIREVSFRDWCDFVMPLLDMRFTFRTKGKQEQYAILKHLYEQLVNGHYETVCPKDFASPPQWNERGGKIHFPYWQLYFKNGLGLSMYNHRFGYGALVKVLPYCFERFARVKGQADRLGMDPQRNLTRLLTIYKRWLKTAIYEAQARVRQTDDGIQVTQANSKALQELKALKRRYEVFNENTTPEAVKMALAQLNGMACMPKYAISEVAVRIRQQPFSINKFNEFQKCALEMATNVAYITSDAKNAGFLNILTYVDQALEDFLNEDGNPQDAYTQNTLLDVFYEQVTYGLVAYWAIGSSDGGWTSACIENTSALNNSLNGTPWWHYIVRQASAFSFAHHLGAQAACTWSELSDSLQQILKHVHIERLQWDVLRQSVMTYKDGRKYLTLEGIEKLDDVAFEPWLQDLGAHTQKEQAGQKGVLLSDLREQLWQNFNTLMTDWMQHIITPLELNTPKPDHDWLCTFTDSIETNFLYYVREFKSLPLMLLMLVHGKSIHNFKQENVAGVLNNGSISVIQHASTLLLLTMIAYVRIVLKDLRDEDVPLIDPDRQLFLKAMENGGGMALYIDNLCKSYEIYDGSAVGAPKWQIEDVLNHEYDEDDNDKTKPISQVWKEVCAPNLSVAARKKASKAIEEAFERTPSINLIYDKLAFDYLTLRRVKEVINPEMVQDYKKARNNQ